ncbi:MAG: 16S rRNA (guanine(966)-N(2))-methyltransferase RsmD [Deltaproteobacteria bacterium]|nr:MAG: 16S rRNA (guanine(966)-N(2))-methyltransferase RsmD [Deltaproteobacteria bacterium]
MRIIGGWARSRRLVAPAGTTTRPTSDRVREALFNILGPPPVGAAVLDLFAGAGGLGLEALSRGAATAVFVDTSRSAVKCLRANVDALGVASAVSVVCADAIAAIRRLDAQGRRFHWVFADPPYATDLADRALVALGDSALVAEGGIAVVEHAARRPTVDAAGALVRTDRREYGDTALSFYGRVPA